MPKYIVMTTNKHPERSENVKKMKEQIPNLIISVDPYNNIMKHFLAICEKYTDFVLLEDDVQLCNNFTLHIGKALNDLYPNIDVVSFFDLKGELKKKNNHCMNQCVYIYNVVGISKNWFDFIEKYPQHSNAVDLLLDYYIKQNKLNYKIHRPNLVQHLNFKSTLGARSTFRQTKHFIDEERLNNENKL